MAPLAVLLVEDDEAISSPVVRGLRREGYEVHLAVDGQAGLHAGLDPSISLVLLDIGLPHMGGVEICRRLRKSRPTIQIVLLTAGPEEVAAVDGLGADADDFVTKPFRLEELLVRVRAAARRADIGTLVAGPIRIDSAARRAFLRGAEVALSPKEFDLLTALVRRAGQVVTRERLLRDVWQSPLHTSGRTLDQHISWLRSKIGPELIATVRGTGFRFDRDP